MKKIIHFIRLFIFRKWKRAVYDPKRFARVLVMQDYISPWMAKYVEKWAK